MIEYRSTFYDPNHLSKMNTKLYLQETLDSNTKKETLDYLIHTNEEGNITTYEQAKHLLNNKKQFKQFYHCSLTAILALMRESTETLLPHLTSSLYSYPFIFLDQGPNNQCYLHVFVLNYAAFIEKKENNIDIIASKHNGEITTLNDSEYQQLQKSIHQDSVRKRITHRVINTDKERYLPWAGIHCSLEITEQNIRILRIQKDISTKFLEKYASPAPLFISLHCVFNNINYIKEKKNTLDRLQHSTPHQIKNF